MLQSRTLMGRALLLGSLLLAEVLASTLSFDGATVARQGLAASIGAWGPWCARALLAFAAIFATFTALRYPGVPRMPIAEPIGWARLAGHFAALAGFWQLSRAIFAGSPGAWLPVAWLAAAATLFTLAATAFVPARAWRDLLRQTGALWCYAAGAAGATLATASLFRSLWKPTAKLTFHLVEALLRPLAGDSLVYQPERLRIGTNRFAVIVSEECSGLEGIGLLIVFGLVCLFLFRRDLRFPHCLIVFPAGIVTLFLLNSLRIATLAVIGHLGAREIARQGFHSQAGWIAFNFVAFGLCWFAQRWRWLWRRPPVALPVEQEAAPDATTSFLMPFLAILAAGMVAGAMAAGFEWAYALRVCAAAAFLWHYRAAYAGLNWRPAWPALWGGLAVFAIWIGAEWWSATPAAPMPAPLAQSDAVQRWAWIAVRVLGAIVTVPLAEELAFRGFLLRRWQQEEFARIPLTQWTWGALLVSSALFGALHGSRWLPGMAAGIIFGLVMLRRGSIGDAAGAHALTNALIALVVLERGQWQLW